MSFYGLGRFCAGQDWKAKDPDTGGRSAPTLGGAGAVGRSGFESKGDLK